jgi:hypothetical protein
MGPLPAGQAANGSSYRISKALSSFADSPLEK